jgi:hypothetical protein
MKFEIYSRFYFAHYTLRIDNFKIFAKINRSLTVRSPFRSVNLNFSRYKTIRSFDQSTIVRSLKFAHFLIQF